MRKQREKKVREKKVREHKVREKKIRPKKERKKKIRGEKDAEKKVRVKKSGAKGNNRKSRKKQTLAGKVNRRIMALVAFVIFATLFIAYYMTISTLKSRTMEWMDSIAAGKVEEINLWINSNTEILHNNITTLNSMNKKEQYDFTVCVQDSYTNIPGGIYVAYPNKDLWYPAYEGMLPEDFDPTTREWYQSAMSHQNGMQFTDPYIDTASGKMCITLSQAISSGNAVIGADLFLNKLSDKVSNIDLTNGSRAYICDAKGQIIASEDRDMLGQQMSSLSEDIASDIFSGRFSDEYIVHSEKYLSEIALVKDTGWYFVLLAPNSEVMSASTQMVMIFAGIGVLALIILSLTVIFVVRSIVNPIGGVNRFMGEVAEGKLSGEIVSQDNTEVGQMVDAINRSVASIRLVITDIMEQAEVLNQATDKSLAASEVLEGHAAQEQHNVQAIADSMQEMTDAVEDVASKATELSGYVGAMNGDNKRIKMSMQTAAESSQMGLEKMQVVTHGIQEIRDSIHELETTVGEATTLTAQISKIITMIQGIAEETNLLSLNASIEAARAGESGRGFAVVAEQIKKLADSSSSSAADISALIKQINAIMEVTAQQTTDNVNRIGQSVEEVASADAQFQVIYEAVDSMDQGVEEMIDKINRISDIAQVLAATTEEQSATVSSISGATDNLRDTVEDTVAQVAVARETTDETQSAVARLKDRAEQFQI